MHDYRHLTLHPDLVPGLAPVAARQAATTAPLPRLTVPDHEPLVAAAAPRPPLVELVPSPRLVLVEAYRRAGWTSAVPGAWLLAPIVDRLQLVLDDLPEPFGLAVFDAWRPLTLQRELYDEAYDHPGLPPGFVAPPDPDPRRPPPHLTGATIDLTLTFAGTPLALGTGFDDFTARAHADALEDEPGPERDLRRLLVHAMHAAGFVVLDCEWWHFEHGTRYWAAVTGHDPVHGPAAPPAPSAAGSSDLAWRLGDLPGSA